jgi:hypothetical protein
MIGFHAQIREKLPSLYMLWGWSSISVAPLKTNCILRKAIEIELHPDSMNMDDGFKDLVLDSVDITFTLINTILETYSNV